MRRLTLIAVLVIIATNTQSIQATTALPTYRIVGYFTAWGIYTRQYFVTDIPADKLTHINYAFINLNDAGECISGDPWSDTGYLYPGDRQSETLRGNFKQLRLLKEAYPHLRILMSVGGWTWSDKFSEAALTPESRARLVDSCIEFMKRYGFDGIDLDWEFPVSGGLTRGKPEDKANFTALLAEFRQKLLVHGEHDQANYLLTIAVPTTQRFYQNFDLGQIAPLVDWMNLMAYSFHGGWSKMTNFIAPLYASSTDPSEDEAMRRDFNVAAAVKAYQQAGVPAEKIIIGVPFYGLGWQGVSETNHGLYQSFADIPNGTFGDGVYDYRDLEANYLGVYQRFWNAEAQAPWLYDPISQIMISYDDAESLAAKANYVKQQGLGGIMIWELDYDTKTHTLLDAIVRQLQ